MLLGLRSLEGLVKIARHCASLRDARIVKLCATLEAAEALGPRCMFLASSDWHSSLSSLQLGLKIMNEGLHDPSCEFRLVFSLSACNSDESHCP
jgi:hypothetical protein